MNNCVEYFENNTNAKGIIFIIENNTNPQLAVHFPLVTMVNCIFGRYTT